MKLLVIDSTIRSVKSPELRKQILFVNMSVKKWLASGSYI